MSEHVKTGINRRSLLRGVLAAAATGPASTAWATPRSRQPSTSERDRLRALASAFLKEYDMPGLSVAIAQHGQLVYTEGFGVADRVTGERVTPAHLFRVASISKPITSVCIFSLIEQGQLKLTDHVFGERGILGSEFDASSRPYVQDVTVGHLLQHLSGGWSNNPSDPMDTERGMSQRELIGWTLKNKPLRHPPGTTFAYSNFGYCVLGRVIEKVANMGYADYVRRAVLARCGIKEMRIAGSSRSQRADREVAYYHRAMDPYAKDMERIDSTGGWLASTTDLALFATHVGDFSHPPSILSSATIKTMTTPSKANPHYAHGWSVLKGNWRHDGRLPGTTATLVRTQSGYCWAALTNSSNRYGNRGLDDVVWKMVQSIEHWSPGQPPHRQ